MKRYSLFLLLSISCGTILLITADELFSQRGMKITVRTETGKEIPLYANSYALVVGNGNYTNGWSPLDGALQDVKEVKTTLEKHSFHVTLKTNLNAAAFRRAFAEFVLKSGKDRDNRLLFYFAGHGYTRKSATNDDLGYLVMVGAPLPQTDEVGFELESIDMESLVTQAEKILARHALFVFDSCFSGTILNTRDDKKRPESISDSVAYPVRQFITAGRAGETVPDNSAFKEAFLNLLEGRADEPFPDGYITGEELGFYLKNQVPVYSSAQHPQYGKIRNPKLDQGDFVFVLGNTDTPEIVEPLSTIATLRVTSTPSGATVYLDGKPIGSTPLSNHQIDTGVRRKKQVEVGLELSGYKSQVARLTLKGGDITPWDIQLKKMGTSKQQTQTQSSPQPAPLSGRVPEGMVLIPAGEFQMGSNDRQSGRDEKPVHTVYIDAFYMDVYEVTNAQYKEFIDANPQWQKDRILRQYRVLEYLQDWTNNNYPIGKGNHPVVYVGWYGAMAYAVWAGKRLPTEAEWEKAARGGLIGKRYPWGNSIDSSKVDYNMRVRGTTPVGHYSANGYGLYDMAGNVYEWCLDVYDKDFYGTSPYRNPVSGASSITQLINEFKNGKLRHKEFRVSSAISRVVRGGSWYGILPLRMRVSSRWRYEIALRDALRNVGFRCVRSATP